MQSTYQALAPRAPQPQRVGAHSRLTLGTAFANLWSFMQALGQRKAVAEILDLADSLQATRPEMAAQMRRAAARSWD